MVGISADWDDTRGDDRNEVLQRISQDFESPIEPVLRFYLQDLDVDKVDGLLEILPEYEPFSRRRSGAVRNCDLVLGLRIAFESRESFVTECMRVSGLLSSLLDNWNLLAIYEGDRFGTKTYIFELFSQSEGDG